MGAVMSRPIAILRPVRMEIPAPCNGRPGYAWVEGFEVTAPNGPLAPYMRKREARAYCRDHGWAVEVRK